MGYGPKYPMGNCTSLLQKGFEEFWSDLKCQHNKHPNTHKTEHGRQFLVETTAFPWNTEL